MFMAGLHLRYKTNTDKTRRVLSFHYLGFLRGYVNKRLILFCEQYKAAVLNLRIMIAGNNNLMLNKFTQIMLSVRQIMGHNYRELVTLI
jgi:hypothetical protein